MDRGRWIVVGSRATHDSHAAWFRDCRVPFTTHRHWCTPRQYPDSTQTDEARPCYLSAGTVCRHSLHRTCTRPASVGTLPGTRGHDEASIPLLGLGVGVGVGVGVGTEMQIEMRPSCCAAVRGLGLGWRARQG
eukprot:scaffold55092_cov47-Phaeocystis_antarctica.AAC.3